MVHFWCNCGAVLRFDKILVHFWCTFGALLVHFWYTCGALLGFGATLVHFECTCAALFSVIVMGLTLTKVSNIFKGGYI